MAIAVVVVATLVLLFAMTGSVAIPIKAVVMNVLSLGASFGALVWVFQDGNLSGLLGFDPVGSIDLWLPVARRIDFLLNMIAILRDAILVVVGEFIDAFGGLITVSLSDDATGRIPLPE